MSEPAPQRRLLIISTTFYPDPQVSAIRMTQWARHLPEHGWQVHVMCRHYGFECGAEELARVVHPAVTLEYLDKPGSAPGMLEAGGGARDWIRRVMQRLLRFRSFATLIVPDSSIRFWRKQRQAILKRVQEIRPEVILTTSPPHSNHDIGLWLTAQTGIPWVADFRDPYLLDNRFRPAGLGMLRWWAHKRFRESIFGRAWLVTFAIPVQARWTAQDRPDARQRMLTLTNAAPPGLAVLADQAPNSVTGIKTVLVAGTIPEPQQCELARAVARLVSRGHDVRLQIIGRRPGCAAEMQEVLGERLLLPDYLSHTETLQEMARADVLVNFLDVERGSTLLLSTKLFEYLATGRPVVCINPSRSDRHLLRGKTGVVLLERPSLPRITDALENALHGKVRRDAAEVTGFRREFAWPQRVSQLAAALDKLVAFPPKQGVMPTGAPVASVVIPTRNRGELLACCIRSALAQSVPVEVIVMDDGSTDGTAEMMAREFPQVCYCRLAQGQGPAFQRNRGIELAASEFVFPIDDDSVFSSPQCVEQTLREFDHPRVAAVGIPFLNPRLDWTLLQRDSTHAGCHAIHAFVGAAHAVRRSVFLSTGGYREHFFYMGEEGDLCLRMLARGFITRLGRADPVHHMESPRRNQVLANRCGRRNDVFFAWQNVPSSHLWLHLLGTTFNGVLAGLATQHLLRMLGGTLEGYLACLRGHAQRMPVSTGIYLLHRRLKKDGPMALHDIEPLLPALPMTDDNQPTSPHVC